MQNTYLNVPYAEKDAAKALGARWDAAARQWYAPPGTELTPLAPWLPAELAEQVTATQIQPASSERAGNYQVAAVQGMPLSALLNSVRSAILRSFQQPAWVLVEVLRVNSASGHVYLELCERGPSGNVLATARGVIWAGSATQILPRFERDTGVTLASGIKLLVQAQPSFHSSYGFSLVIEGISSDYTLGDLEARKREIRLRLQQKGVITANKQLAAPWDFNHVLVIAPPDAAGLGDFQAEAQRLQQSGLCQFTYVHSRFQGEGAPAQLREAFLQGIANCAADNPPDAVVIIRGGGAVNDLAWLNDYELAEAVCLADYPVFTGIGHERDSTVLDEVAHSSFDTPSKVIAAIEQLIQQRAAEAKDFYLQLQQHMSDAIHQQRASAENHLFQIQRSAMQNLINARRTSTELMEQLRQRGYQLVSQARSGSGALLEDARNLVYSKVQQVRSRVPVLLMQIVEQSTSQLRESRSYSGLHLSEVVERSGKNLLLARQSVEQEFSSLLQQGKQSMQLSRQQVNQNINHIEYEAGRNLKQARQNSQSLFREIAGQGPQKTLQRGFSLVRDSSGKTLASTQNLAAGDRLEIQFYQGSLEAQVTLVNTASKKEDV